LFHQGLPFQPKCAGFIFNAGMPNFISDEGNGAHTALKGGALSMEFTLDLSFNLNQY